MPDDSQAICFYNIDAEVELFGTSEQSGVYAWLTDLLMLQVRGYGLSGDANHITQPAPDGVGARLAMQRAMQAAGAQAADIAYINAHATSTPMGDAVEQQAMLQTVHRNSGAEQAWLSPTLLALEAQMLA